MRIVWLYSILLLIYFSSMPLAYASPQKECLDRSILTTILHPLIFYSWNSSIQKWQSHQHFDLCDFNAPQTKVLQSLSYLYRLEQQSSTFSPSSLAFKEGPFTFFKSRVKNIYFHTQLSPHCNSGVVAYTNTNAPDSIYLCTQNESSFVHQSLLNLSTTLIHEVRHLMGPSAHVSCQHGAIFDKDTYNKKMPNESCDTDYESQGAYGLETAFLLDVYKTSQDPIEKFTARAEAISKLLKVFNKLPLNIKKGTVSVSRAQGALFYPDSKASTDSHSAPQISYSKIFNIHQNVNAATLVANRLYLYSKDNKPLIYAHSNSLFNANDDFSNFYEAHLKPTQHQFLLDVFYSSYSLNYGCFLFKNSLVCKDQNSTQTHTISFSTLNPRGFYILKNSTTRQQMIFLVDTEGITYSLPHQFSILSRLAEKDLVSTAVPHHRYSQSQPQLQMSSSEFARENPFSLLLTEQNRDLNMFLSQAFSLPKNYLLEQIKVPMGTESPSAEPSTWVLGPFYWSKEIESL